MEGSVCSSMSSDCVAVKEEVLWEQVADSRGVSEAAALAGLYTDHQVKDELVIEPEVLQPPDAVFTADQTCMNWEPPCGCHRDHTYAITTSPEAKVLVKEEAVEWLREAAREAPAGREVPADCVGPLERRAGREARRGTRRAPNSAHVGNQTRAKTDIDTGKGTFVCDICEQRFALKARLMEHVLIHIHSTEREESERGVADNASATHPMEAVWVKHEPQWDSDDANYELDEEQELAPVVLKEELELGPVVLQPPDAVYAFQALQKKERPDCGPQAVPRRTCSVVLEPMLVDMELCVCKIARQVYEFRSCPESDVSQSDEEFNASKKFGTSVTAPLEAAGVKPEQGWDSDGHSETEDHELNEELVDEDLELGPVVLKEELELGPVVLQPPDALYSRRGQIRLPAAKKTKSAKTRKPKAPVKEKKAKYCEKKFKHNFAASKRKAPVADKKEKPNKKIAKTNSAKINPGTSAASQELSSTPDIREATPEEPAGSSSCSEVNTLTAETNFKCKKCGKGFNIKSDLEKHLNTHMLMEASTSRKASKFTCKTCNCIFDTKLLLQEHEKSRHGVKYFACDECEYATKRARHLPAHLRTHTGEKPFKCSQCSSAFTQSSNLHNHLKTHSGEKPFKCRQCSSAFTQNIDLQRHLRTHTGEKPFKCSQCTFAFSQNSHLQSHLRTHTGEKPFECNICDYKTARSGYLKSHLMSRHGQKPFGCDACSYRGATRGRLRQHMKRCHKPA